MTPLHTRFARRLRRPFPVMPGVFAALCAIAVLPGCMSLSGYDGSGSFACKAPDGVICTSMTGVYENAKQSNLPGQQSRRPASPANERAADMLEPGTPALHTALEPRPAEVLRRKYFDASGAIARTATLDPGMPLRSAPRVQRIWIAPWQDADGDLHDGAHLYVLVEPGHWALAHHRSRLRQTYAPVLRAPVTVRVPTASTVPAPSVNTPLAIDRSVFPAPAAAQASIAPSGDHE